MTTRKGKCRIGKKHEEEVTQGGEDMQGEREKMKESHVEGEYEEKRDSYAAGRTEKEWSVGALL
jgi:hypothetical protein